jgi:hypothetical protein
MGQVCCLVYTKQKLHIMPEEEIPKKERREMNMDRPTSCDTKARKLDVRQHYSV